MKNKINNKNRYKTKKRKKGNQSYIYTKTIEKKGGRRREKKEEFKKR